MPLPLTISLGGIPISLTPDQATGEYDFVKRAIEFYTNAAPEVKLKIHCGWFPDLHEIPVAFETNHGWQLLQGNGKKVIKVRTAFQDPYLVGVFSVNFRSGDIYVAASEGFSDRYIFPLNYPLGELYMVNLLGTGLGMLFHAAGVIYQGQGYLFTGHGGAGKTTTSRLWRAYPDVRVVNDDKVIVRKEADGFRLYGTPWHGEGGMALPDSAPLKRVFILKQAAQNTTTPLQPIQAVSGLLTRAFIPLWDAEKMTNTLEFLDELCQAIPCQELGFLPDSSVVDIVRNLP